MRRIIKCEERLEARWYIFIVYIYCIYPADVNKDVTFFISISAWIVIILQWSYVCQKQIEKKNQEKMRSCVWLVSSNILLSWWHTTRVGCTWNWNEDIRPLSVYPISIGTYISSTGRFHLSISTGQIRSHITKNQ